MPVNQSGHRGTAPLVARLLALCRRLRQAIGHSVWIVVQGAQALSHERRAEPDQLPASQAKPRTKAMLGPARRARAKSPPFVIRDHVLRLVKPGHAEFVFPRNRLTAGTAPRATSQPQPETAPGEPQVAPKAESKR